MQITKSENQKHPLPFGQYLFNIIRYSESKFHISFYNFSHNDPHNGNIMIDNDENDNLRPDTMMLIDFDNAAWGYRAWDIDYYFSKWPVWPTTAVMEDFVEAYLEEFNQNGVNLTKDELMLELRYHQPYVLLEQMLFYYVFLDGYKSPAHLNAYCDVMLNYFQRSGWSVNM